MTPRFTVTRKERVDATSVFIVYFAYGVGEEGNVCVHESRMNDRNLNAIISTQLDRLQDQREQLAAGGD